MSLIPPLTFLAPLILLAVALYAALNPGRRPGRLPLLAEGATVVALILAALGMGQLLANGP